jgi:hypothetical protein
MRERATSTEEAEKSIGGEVALMAVILIRKTGLLKLPR